MLTQQMAASHHCWRAGAARLYPDEHDRATAHRELQPQTCQSIGRSKQDDMIGI
jgi:hypothetical protein